MPNVKISQLPYNGNPDTAALIPLVQGGVTYRTDFVQIINVMLVPELASVFQETGLITQNIFVDGTSTIKYPSAKAVKDYADSLVVGLLSDRGNYTPGLVSPGAFPSTGGRGPGGIPAKGDLWFVAANGFLGTTAVTTGQSVRALTDAPGQTSTNWDILDVAGWTVAPEDSSNKVISKAQFIANGSSTVKYPSIKAVKDYIDFEVTLQDVITNDNSLANNINAQGTNSGTVMAPGVQDINAFGGNAATSNQGTYINAFGPESCNGNSGDDVNAIGRQSAENNSGNNVEAIGFFSAQGNQGDYVVAIGTSAAFANARDGLNAIGFEAGKNNAGSRVNGIGYRAALGNLGNYVMALGENAATNNTGQDVNVIGRNSGVSNTGDYVSGIGDNAAINNTGFYVNAFGNNAGNSNSHDHVTLLGKNASADGPFQLVLSDGTKNARFDANNIPADTKLTLPTASGTIVTSVNGTPPDPAGNVTLPGANPSLPYLMYAAFLNPAASIGVTQLYNTIGDGSGDGINDIGWSYNSGGFQATMSAAPFTTKSVVMPGGYFGLGTFWGLTGFRVSSSSMIVYSWQANQPANQQGGYPFNVNIYVEIRIYP